MRHCVRSTKDHVDLYYNYNGEDQQQCYDAQDFIGVPFPNWTVPEMQCTPHGLKMIQEMAQYIFQTLFQEEKTKHNKNVINIQIVTDSSQRDVDTSVAFHEGFTTNTTYSSFFDLLQLQYDHSFFDPVDAGFCRYQHSTERQTRDVLDRLASVVPPESNLTETLQLLERLGGVGHKASLTNIYSEFQPLNTNNTNNNNSTHFMGAINLVKLYSQMAFFSRVSQINPPFLPNATRSNIRFLLQWVYWSRSVLYIGNVKSATRGSVLVYKLIQALERGYHNIIPNNNNNTRQKIPPSPDNEDDGIKVVIYVGHDTNLDACATTLGLEWDLPTFLNNDDNNETFSYNPTLPGSGLHFEYDTREKSLSISYLYPNFDKDWMLRSFQKAPVQFQKRRPIHTTTTNDDWYPKKNHLSTTQPTSFISLDVLRNRLEDSLHQYPESMECYERIVHSDSIISSAHTIICTHNKLVWGSFTLSMCFFLMTILVISSSKWKTRRNKDY